MAGGGYDLHIPRQKNSLAEQVAHLPAVGAGGVPVGRYIAEFLAIAPREEPLVRAWGGSGWLPNPLSSAAWRDALRTALQRAGLPTVGQSTHALRKGAFTAAAEADVPYDVAQRQIGHRSAASGEVYRRRPADTMRGYMEVI